MITFFSNNLSNQNYQIQKIIRRIVTQNLIIILYRMWFDNILHYYLIIILKTLQFIKSLNQLQQNISISLNRMGCLEAKQSKNNPVNVARSSVPNSHLFKVQCNICLQQYNLTTKIPLTLQCFHSLCLQCLNKLSKKECPFDNKPFTEHGKNFQLINTIQTFQGKKIKKKQEESKVKFESPVKKPFEFQKDNQPESMERAIEMEPRRIDDIEMNLNRLRPPQRIFAPRDRSLSPIRLNNFDHRPCEGSHRFTFLAYQAKCSVCSSNARCSQCNICRIKECITCHAIPFNAQKCPNSHPTKWFNTFNKCTQCARLDQGRTCAQCSYNLCDSCCKTVFSKICPNNHETKWVSYKDKCMKCKNFARGFHCVSCSYHFCQSCSNMTFDRNMCPNKHTTVTRSIRSTCTKCQNIEIGKSCTVCLYHICNKCK